MEIKIFSNPVYATTYLCLEGNQAMIIDPGAPNGHLVRFLKENGIIPKGILLTHGHFDHIAGMAHLLAAFGEIPVYLHEEELDFLEDIALNGSYMHPPHVKYEIMAMPVTDSSEIVFFGHTFMCMHTPGHTGGSVCYLAGNFLFTGDTLFKNDIGRTDLATGSHRKIISSLGRLKELAEHHPEIIVFPGHDQATTLGKELINNRYFRN